MKKKYRKVLKDFLAACVITVLVILASSKEQIPTSTEEVNNDLIRWKQEISVEPLEVDIVEETAPKMAFYDVPLSKDLQLHIFAECEKHNIAPAIVIAMIEQESNWKLDAIGDDGNSFGLMQVQKHHHKERMDRLGCTDILDPFQNVTVGIDYLAELKEENSDLYWVLMAYNGGRAYSTSRMDSGNYSDYAIEVVERASELEWIYQND